MYVESDTDYVVYVESDTDYVVYVCVSSSFVSDDDDYNCWRQRQL